MVLIGVAGTAALILAPGPPERTPAPSPPLAEFVAVEAATDRVGLRSEGFVRAMDRIDLVSEVEGRILRVADGLRAGARFPAGTVLVEIDPELHEAELRDARARLAGARAELERAENQVDRLEPLASDELVSSEELERVQIERDAAAAQVAQHEAAVERARIRLADTRLRAPFAAEVISEDATVGRLLRPGETVAGLAAVAAAEIEIGLAPAQAALLLALGDDAVGLPARVTPATGATATDAGEAGRTFAGVVQRIEPRIDPQARTLDVVVRVPDAFAGTGGSRLRLDELVEVELRLPTQPHWFRLPPTALKAPGRLWRLDDADDAPVLEAVDAKVVLRTPERMIVHSRGLAAGDRILVTDLTAPAPDLRVRPLAEARGDADAP